MRAATNKQFRDVQNQLGLIPQGTTTFEEDVVNCLDRIADKLDALGERCEAIEDRLDQLILDEKKS